MEAPPAAPRPPALGVDVGVFAAATAGGSGLVHLAMAPGRADDAASLGVALVVVALVQFAVAGLVHRGATLRAWFAVVAVEAVIVGAWLAAWTAGWPIGPRDGAWSLHLADVVACALGALALVAAALAVVAPAAVARAREGEVRATSRSVIGVVVVAAAVALVSPGALDAREPARTAGADATAAVSTTVRPRLAPIEDQLGGTLVVPGDAGAASPTTAAGAAAPTMSGAPSLTTTTVLGDRGFAALAGGRRAFADVAIDAATRTALAAQLAGTASLVTTYPTVGAAEAAGYRRAGPFSPGVGVPYAPPRPPGNLDGRMDPADVAAAVLLFEGTAAASRLVGFEYLSTRAQTDGEPEGFAGPNDHWTFVRDVCQVVDDRGGTGTPLGIDRSVSREQCNAIGGTLVPSAWFALRVWTVPGYDVADGIFRDLNPAITCPDGTYFVKPVEQLGSSTTLCRG